VDLRLDGKVALVTGASRGIGRAIATAFAGAGARVLISSRKQDALEEAAREMPGEVAVFAANAGEPDQAAACVAFCVERFGGIDVLVNNAAHQMALDGLESLSTEQLERTYRTNVFAMVWLCKAALPHLLPGASIINTSSIQAYQPSPPLLDYASTKAAIVNFTKNLSQELATRGVRVNAVAPGPVWTPLIPATMPPENVSEFGQETPLGRAGQPAELAPAYVFFASQESSYVTGEVLGVTGGGLLPS
jgi:NAD(P)-dependent dehydrogenase (short-subunit alcohol dehydrogenase family)